jgi:glycoprotein endo-alpha-1,2-mannosidase
MKRLLWVVAGAACFATVATPVGSGSAPVTSDRSGRVAIFYYPWYSTPRLDGQWTHWYALHDGKLVLSTRYFPSRGLYSSSNPRVVDAQMRDIGAAGIDTVVVSWWGPTSREAERLPLVIEAARRRGLLVAVHLEPYAGRTPETTARDIEELAALGVTDFYVYDADRDQPAEWAAALATLEHVRVFGQTTLVGRAKAAGFDGLYTYDVGTWTGSTFMRLCAQAHAAGLLCAPSVGPGYDARLATGDELVRVRRGGWWYDNMWRRALRADADLVTITSYNEWQEGTQIEPARAETGRRGYDGAWGRAGAAAQRAYLDATGRWTARLRSAVPQ